MVLLVVVCLGCGCLLQFVALRVLTFVVSVGGLGWLGFVVVVLVVVWRFVYRFGVDCCFLAVFVVAVVLCWLMCYCLVGAA